MKKYHYSILLSSLTFLFIVYWFFVKPIFDTKKKAIYGKVISIMELKRDAGYEISVSENKKIRLLYYSLKDIEIGDSVIKKVDSKILYVKRKDDSIFRVAKGKKYTIFK